MCHTFPYPEASLTAFHREVLIPAFLKGCRREAEAELTAGHSHATSGVAGSWAGFF